jgi:hypothetical protein
MGSHAWHQLPATLAPLCRRNALEISDSRFHDDVKRLIRTLDIGHRARPHPRSTLRARSLRLLSAVQIAGAWVAFVLSFGDPRKGDDTLLGVWLLLWLSGAVLVELGRREKNRSAIFLGLTMPLALIVEVALETGSGYSGALGYSHWAILRMLSLTSALVSSGLALQYFIAHGAWRPSLGSLPLIVIVMIALLWLVSRYF